MARALTSARPVSATAAATARLSIGSGLLFLLLLGSLHVLEPEFDPTWRFISEYALGQFGWMMQLAFFSLAVSFASAGVSLLPQIRTWPGYVGLGLLGLAAIGLTLAGWYNTDPATGAAVATFSGKMHVLGASLDWTPVAVLLLSFALARNEAWYPVRWFLFVTAGITLIAMVAFMMVLPYDGQIGPGVLAGLFGRFLIVSYLGWFLTVGAHVLKLRVQRIYAWPPLPALASSARRVRGRG